MSLEIALLSDEKQDNSYVSKLIAVEASIEAFRDKIRNFTPSAPMIGLNCKKMKKIESESSDIIDEEGEEEEDDEAPSQLNEAMIQERSGDHSDESDQMDPMFTMDEMSSDDAVADH